MDKRTLRKRTWGSLREAGAARFPGAVGRIPNFTGAERAAARLADEPAWKAAHVLKCNPDLPQRPVRHRALREGKRLYMAVPRLAEAKPFVRLDPATLAARDLWRASSIVGAFELGTPVALEELEPIHLVVIGAVAATRDGARLGKGGGYADLELALLRELGLVGARTPVATTLHRTQLLPRGALRMEEHDVRLDLLALEDRVIRCEHDRKRPPGVLWDRLSAERRDAIPVLRGGPPRARGRARNGARGRRARATGVPRGTQDETSAEHAPRARRKKP